MGSLICLTPQPDKYLCRQRQSGWMEVGMLLKTGIDARWPTEDLSHFRYFQTSWIHISGLACCSNLTFPWRDLGWGCSFWGVGASKTSCIMRTCSTLHCLFINHNDSLWLTFTYLNVKITCVLRETSDSGCGFTSGHFLINGWTVLGLGKTLLRNRDSVLVSVCVEGLGKGLLCVGLNFSLWVPWGVPWLCELWGEWGLMTVLFWCFFRAFLPSPDVGAWSLVLGSTVLRNAIQW